MTLHTTRHVTCHDLHATLYTIAPEIVGKDITTGNWGPPKSVKNQAVCELDGPARTWLRVRHDAAKQPCEGGGGPLEELEEERRAVGVAPPSRRRTPKMKHESRTRRRSPPPSPKGTGPEAGQLLTGSMFVIAKRKQGVHWNIMVNIVCMCGVIGDVLVCH